MLQLTMDSPPSSDPGLSSVTPPQSKKCDDGGRNHILPYQFVLQDHNYGAPPPPTPPLSPSPPQPAPAPLLNVRPPLSAHDLCGIAALATVADQVRTGGLSMLVDGDDESPLSSDEHDGEETETAAEGEGDDDSVTRCICDFEHDDGYMICCDKCFVWQHVDCMGIDRTNIPEEYLCELCKPRRVDRNRARNLQLRKQMHTDSTSSDDEHHRRMPKAKQAQQQRPPKRNNEPKKVVKRQRTVAAREQRRARNKTDSKKIAARRRSKGKPDTVDEETQDCWGEAQPLRDWIDNYEEAVTNHYSPELRARISSIKVNGIHSDFKVANSTSLNKCRTSLMENGVKVLISTCALQRNQPIVEIRGKYMLANQQQIRGGRGVLNSPYTLFYTLPKDGTDVCVDQRTYGNDARFVRSSCKPNAEIRHCIEKGALHLYLVASCAVDKYAEISIKHEDSGPRAACQNCNNLTSPTQQSVTNNERVERRRRGSRRTTSSEENTNLPLTVPPSLTGTTTTAVPVPEPIVVAPPPLPPPPPAAATTPVTPVTPISPVIAVSNVTPVASTPTTPSSPRKSTPKSPVKLSEDSNDGNQSHDDSNNTPDKRKMTREERKMEAIMKAFERLEKAQQRRQESLAKKVDTEENEPLANRSRPKGFLRNRRTRGRSASLATADEMQHNCNTTFNSPPPTPEKSLSLDFKFPKTKKVLMNEWLSKPIVSPIKESGVAAKKRWLRQAISEETEPIHSTGSPPNGDYVTPLKKRRMARESVSSECTPPTTPACEEQEPIRCNNTTINAARCVEEAVAAMLASPIKEEGSCDVKVEVKVEAETPELQDFKQEVHDEGEKACKEEPTTVNNITNSDAAADVMANDLDDADVDEKVCPPPPPPPTDVLAAAAIKRKLSISEYRQRNKQRVESPCNEDDSSSTEAPSNSQDSQDKGEMAKWNCEPTMLERQRENLTERLRREFGLCLDEQEANKETEASTSSKNEEGVSLPVLAPLVAPVVKATSRNVVPLPTCSPPPLLELLTDAVDTTPTSNNTPVTTTKVLLR